MTMYKVMLIDDDVPMLLLLEQMIDWESMGLNIVGTSYSSTKAYRMFKETMPDIVISDIGLPKKDGIELAGSFIELKPSVRIIFLTCHEDFHYAQKALKLDVDDYLIKDQLTEQQLMTSLNKSISQLNPKEFGVGDKMSNYSLEIHKKGLFKRLVDGFNSELTLAHAAQLGIKWESPSFMISVANISFASFEELYTQKDFTLVLYGAYNIAQELAKIYEGITVFMEQDNLVFIYNYRSNLASNASQHFQAYVKELQRNIYRFLKVKLLVFVMTDNIEMRSLGLIYKQIVEQKSLFYEGGRDGTGAIGESKESGEGGGLIAVNNATLQTVFLSLAPGFFDSYKAELERAILKQDVAAVHSTTAKMSEAIKVSKIMPQELASALTLHLRNMEALFLKQKLDEDFYAFLATAKTLSEVNILLQKRLLLMMEQRVEKKSAVVQEPKLQVIQLYIDQHISENITSIDVAQYLYLNPSYFSRYFKRLTGSNFTDYVHQYKMKMAEKMLKTSNQSLESLSVALGYSDRTYFSKVFKKYVGVTPSEYKSDLM